MKRIENIKTNYQKQLVEIGEEMNNNYNYSVKISNEIFSWINMASFIIKINETNKFVCDIFFKTTSHKMIINHLITKIKECENSYQIDKGRRRKN